MTPPTPFPTPTPLNTPIPYPKEVKSEPMPIPKEVKSEPIPIPTSSYTDPPLPKSPMEIVANSPAYHQSMRNKKRLAVLEQFNGYPQFNNQGNT